MMLLAAVVKRRNPVEYHEKAGILSLLFREAFMPNMMIGERI